ncbi:HD-GYP domain-containing protein [Bacillaceae bacterium W0354]
MKVHPKDLLPGCLILRDVMGKTPYPIVPRNTVIEDNHIDVLIKFQVPHVEIANKLVNGHSYEAMKEMKEKSKSKEVKKVKEKIDKKNDWTFYDYYVDAVKQTKSLFEDWSNQSKLNIVAIRDMLIPLVEIGEKQSDILIQLHHYTDKRDYFFHHLVAVPVLCSFLAKKLNYDKNERLQIALAAYLSDIGMLLVDHQLYFKDGVLTEEEYERVKKHPVLSYRLIENIKFLSKNVKVAVLQHHERLDGTGYPLGTSNEKIHPFAKLIAVCDTFHAMTSERFYKKKQSPFKVVEELSKHHFGKLDMKIVMELVDSLVNFSNGVNVKLSNNEVGTIVFIDQNHPTRPIVQLENKQIVNLVEHQNLYIDEVMK